MLASTSTRIVVIGSGGSAKIGAAPRRRSLYLSLASGKAFLLAFGTAPDATSGIYITAQTGYIRLGYEDFGSSLSGDGTVYTAAGGADTLVVTECIESP